jgi:hypothetical protein
MGTRSSYGVIETYKDDKIRRRNEFMSMYVQYDGYPEGHPLKVAQWLSEFKVVNGIPVSEKEVKLFNGAGCLAAQLVALMKDGAGGVYMQTPKARGNSWEQYLYDIVVDSDKKDIKFIAYENNDKPEKIFEGSPAEFIGKYSKKDVEDGG